MQDKVRLTLVETARKIGIERWGSENGIEVERTKRNEGAEARYQKRLAEYEALRADSSSSSSSSSSSTSTSTKYPARPSLAKKADWNFIARNQRTFNLMHNQDYGLTQQVFSLSFSLNEPPSIIVTDNPGDHPTDAKIVTNIFEALSEAADGSTILLDKVCYLPTQAQECPEGKRQFLITEGNAEGYLSGATIGGRPQNNMIYLGVKSLHIKGTPRGIIRSNSTCMWSSKGSEDRRLLNRLSSLRVEVSALSADLT